MSAQPEGDHELSFVPVIPPTHLRAEEFPTIAEASAKFPDKWPCPTCKALIPFNPQVWKQWPPNTKIMVTVRHYAKAGQGAGAEHKDDPA